MPTPVIHTKPGEKIVAYFSTRNLYNVLPAAYNSLLYYNPDVHVFLFIEDDTFPHKLPKQITAVNVSSQDIFPYYGPNFRTQYTYMILLKAALTKIFPDADRALILDVDTIVNAPICDLWDLDLNGSYFAGVVEPETQKRKGYPYVNFGVVMLNLAYLRFSGMDNRIIRELNTVSYKYPEQDAFIKLCGHFFHPLPSDYNDTSTGFKFTGTPTRHIITHYACFKNWSHFPLVKHWLTHTTPPPRTVVYMGNRRYYSMLVTAAKSLLCHSPVDRIYFLIEDDKFPDPLPDVIRTINVSDQKIFSPDGPNINGYYTYMTLMRAALTKVLPDEDRVLLLDPDTIVDDDISPIWDTDITYWYFAAVQETRNNDHTPPYYNAGVMLMNLLKLREDGMDDRIIEEINTKSYQHLEQDVLNFFCRPLIVDLPSDYNHSFVTDTTTHPRISHYLSNAKHHLPEAQKPYVNLDWHDVKYADLKGVKHNDK